MGLESERFFGAGSGWVMVKSPFRIIWKELQLFFGMTILMVACRRSPLIVDREQSVDILSSSR